MATSKKSFGELLNDFIAQAQDSNVTIPWIAKQVGIRRGRIHEWINEKRKPNKANLVIDIARVLSLTPEETRSLLDAAGHNNYALPQVLEVGENKDDTASMERLHAYLAQMIPAYESTAKELAWTLLEQDTLSKPPYKGLFAYELQDSEMFLGRDVAISALHEIISKSRLTILHAKSGAGKTSLLQAGLSPILIRERRLPIYPRIHAMWSHDRTYLNPVDAIKGAVISRAIGWPSSLVEANLHDFLTAMLRHMTRYFEEIVIVLDQFEEFFIFQQEEMSRLKFIEDLSNVFNDERLPVRIIIAIRKDYYSDLAEFQPYIRTTFYNNYLLTRMTQQELQETITKPLQGLNTPITYEPDLLKELIGDLERSRLELPHLQVICSDLYEGAKSSGTSYITLAQYISRGGATGILGGFLDQKLEEFGSKQLSAKKILQELVSSHKTKRAVNSITFFTQVDEDQEVLEEILRRLVSQRLLRRDEVAGEIFYELAHEYLIEKIIEWISPKDLGRKSIEETLAFELGQWRAHQMIIPLERLKDIGYRLSLLKELDVDLNFLDKDMVLHLLRSGLTTTFEVPMWVKLAGNRGEALLLESLRSENWEIRRASVQGLGTLWEWPAVSNLGDMQNKGRIKALRTLRGQSDRRLLNPLASLLRDPDEDVAKEATKILLETDGIAEIVPQIKPLLHEVSSHTRRYAAEILGISRDTESADSLLTLLKDPNYNIRASALQSLGRIWDIPELVEIGASSIAKSQKIINELVKRNETRITETLFAVLPFETAVVQLDILESLVLSGNSIDIDIAPLLHLTHNSELAIRLQAIKILGDVGNPEATEPLLALLRDVDENIQIVSIEALGKLKDDKAVSSLLYYLHNAEFPIRWAVVRSLSSIWEFPELSGLGDPNFQVRQQAAKTLRKLRDTQALEPLISTLADNAVEVRQEVIKALGELGDKRAVEFLINILANDNLVLRQNAVLALGKLKDPRALEPLIHTFNDADLNIRKSTIQALGKLEDTRAFDFLVGALADENEYVRPHTILALGKLKDPRALEPLINAFDNSHSIVRKNVIWGLGELKDTRAYDLLVGALTDENATVRQHATQALGKLGDRRAIEPLLSVINDDEAMGVRLDIAKTLIQLGYEESKVLKLLGSKKSLLMRSTVSPAKISEDNRTVKLGTLIDKALFSNKTKERHQAASALGKLKDENAVEPLLQGLSDIRPEIRARAAWALGHIHNRNVVEPLIKALTDDLGWEVRRTAAWALGQLGNRLAIEPLINAALYDNNSVTRRRSAEALAQIARQYAIEVFSKTLNDNDSIVRQRAVRALGFVGDKQIISLLMHLLNDTDTKVREAATHALKRLEADTLEA